jgi:hypothetical protein
MSFIYELSGKKRSFMYQNIKMCNTDYTEATERYTRPYIPLWLTNHSVHTNVGNDNM